MTQHHHGHEHHGPAQETGGLDRIGLTSIGVDIGSATSQVLISRLELRRQGVLLSSRYAVVSREVIYRSPVRLTRFAGRSRIDEASIAQLLQDSLNEMGLSNADIDTGAVILTGEAARRDNARSIAEFFARTGGNFVCATAGHHMEAWLAAHGSGAVEYSREHDARVLNVDIGGGTTKFAAVSHGEVLHTVALRVGARPATVAGSGFFVRGCGPGDLHALAEAAESDRGGPGDLRALAERMAEAIVAVATSAPLPAWAADLMLTDPMPPTDGYEAVIFSGGVSEYLYGRETRSFGDLGPSLARALRDRYSLLPGPVVAPLAGAGRAQGGIRATVHGASEHTVQVSGATIFVSDPDPLALQGLPVVRPTLDLSGEIDAGHVASVVSAALAQRSLTADDPVALALRWQGDPEHQRLAAFARGLSTAMTARQAPVCLVWEGDVARTVGGILSQECGWGPPLVCVDGIEVNGFEFVDVGRRLGPASPVPISIRSLVF